MVQGSDMDRQLGWGSSMGLWALQKDSSEYRDQFSWGGFPHIPSCGFLETRLSAILKSLVILPLGKMLYLLLL